jgi:hypothetical protein
MSITVLPARLGLHTTHVYYFALSRNDTESHAPKLWSQKYGNAKTWIAGPTDSPSLRMCATILAEETIACIRAASRRPERSQAAAERPLLCRALGLALNDRYVRTSCPFSGNRYGCTLHIPPCVRVSARLQESPHLFYQLPPRLARGANPESGHAQFISFPGFLGHAAFT